jgi:GAF domain/Ribbon-helix-helix protein, copG family
VTLKAATIRVSPDLWRLLEQEAARQEISVSQFVRDAALLRVGYLAGARDDEDGLATVEAVAEHLSAARRRFSSEEKRRRLGDKARLRAIEETGLVDSPEDPVLARLTRLAAKALEAPVALMTLVEEEHQFFAGAWGLPEPWASERGTDLLHSFCQHVVVSNQPLLVADAPRHPLVRQNLAIQELDVVAYIGVPLVSSGGHTLGSLCVIDHEPRRWRPKDVELLHDLAAAIMERVENRSASAA